MTESCKDKVAGELRDRLKDIRKLWNMYQRDTEAYDDELGNFSDYGLCFDYVAKGTFEDQDRSYFRYQLSWGGPSDEFRFYVDEDLVPYEIEYWFLHWYDGASKTLKGKDYHLMGDIFDDFKGMGLVQSLLDKVRKG